MTREEQIKEMQEELCSIAHYDFCKDTACVVCPTKRFVEDIYNAGYRKQTTGEWIEHIEKPEWLEDDVEVYYECSCCGIYNFGQSHYCPGCGAKMIKE